MPRHARFALLAGAALSLGCESANLQTANHPTPGLQNAYLPTRRGGAAPAVAALQGGDFAAAERLTAGADDPDARAVRAVVRYQKINRQLFADLRTAAAALMTGSVNDRYLHVTLADAESQLALVEADLAATAAAPGLALELCLACWDVDWNANGRVDKRDHRLFEIERDAGGEPIPEGDPRRRPTFRFDDGDVSWARAFVSFQRAAIDVILAYDWSEIGALAGRRAEAPRKLVVRLADRARVAEARERLLFGLDQSDAARRAYLAETDDDREWVPSPRQRSHPMPLAVDQALYDTWEGVVGDVRRLVKGEEGLSIAGLLALAGAPEEETRALGGYLDIGRMLREPRDLVLDVEALTEHKRRRTLGAALRSLFGEGYAPRMKASPLTGRLARMKGEMDRGEEDLGRKLRYLLWLN